MTAKGNQAVVSGGKLRVAVIGTGSLGKEHARIYSDLAALGRVEFVGVYDSIRESAVRVAEKVRTRAFATLEEAIEQATAAVQGFAAIYEAQWLARFRAKLGLLSADAGDADLVSDLLARMAAQGADFTRTFHGLSNGTARDEFTGPDAFEQWQTRLLARRAMEPDPAAQQAAMRTANPALIPRNHQIEAAINAAVQGDLARFHRLSQALQTPFDLASACNDLQVAPYPDQQVHHTFCGT